MGKLKKKYTEGSSKTYTTRNRALEKLQLNLSDFRRLCILKGIYPVEPKSRKRANRGSTAPTTFYYSKDIQLLLSEPLINKFREHKIFLRRLQRALGKDDITKAKKLEANRPDYTLDHLVIERYPTFVEALRDLDDALCMVFLFSTMPVVTDSVNNEAIEECKKLSAEFMHYAIYSHALRKVFLSIKGIYYQVEIQGQTITWLVPYQFNQHVPLDVDFKVMSAFLQFYRTLLGFVNYRLYTTSNLTYPPKIDQSMDDNAAGLGSLRVTANRLEDLISKQEEEEGKETDEPKADKEDERVKQRMDDLNDTIEKIVANTKEEEEPAYEAVGATNEDYDDNSQGENLMFNKQVFFLSREVPRYSLEFVIRAFGGRLGWDKTSGGGSPYAENDNNITIQIADRPIQGHQFLNRAYVQPQWVYDSINARRLLNFEDYLVGERLPPHLSPFVEYAEGDYVPEAAAAAAGFEGEVTNIKPEDQDQQPSESDNSEDEEVVNNASADEDEPDSDADEDEEVDTKAEKQRQKQLLAEQAGMSFSEYQQKQQGSSKSKSKSGKNNKRSREEIEEEERQKIAISMLSKRKRKIVNRAQDAASKKKQQVDSLESRKAQLNKKNKSKKRAV